MFKILSSLMLIPLLTVTQIPSGGQTTVLPEGVPTRDETYVVGADDYFYWEYCLGIKGDEYDIHVVLEEFEQGSPSSWNVLGKDGAGQYSEAGPDDPDTLDPESDTGTHHIVNAYITGGNMYAAVWLDPDIPEGNYSITVRTACQDPDDGDWDFNTITQTLKKD